MPALTYSYSDFTAYTKIKSTEVNAKFNDIKTLLNTTKLDGDNIQDNIINRSTKIALGTANHVLINSGTGAMSSEAQLAKSRGGTGYDLTTQPLELPEIATPSTPASGFGRVYFKSDGKLYQLNDGGTESAVGGGLGGSKNYLTAYKASAGGGTPNTGNNDLEAGATTGFGLGNVSLTSALPTGTPTFGSGASVNLSISAVSSGQLAGVYSLSYSSSTATTAGNFVATDAFYIDLEDQAKVLGFSFYYKAVTNPSNANWSGTSSNSFGVAIYDVTNSAWIIPAGVFNLVQSSGVGKCSGTFQTSATGTQYRLVVYNANATSGAVTMYMDDFFVGPQITAAGVPASDWIAYTPTFSAGFGTVSTSSFFWRRVGDSMEVMGSFTTGTVAASAARFSLPSGFSIDTAKVPNGGAVIGNASAGISSTAGAINHIGVVIASGQTTNLSFGLIGNGAGSTLPQGEANGNLFSSNAIVETVVARGIPIAGWSSNTVMSADTDTRVVAVRMYRSGALTPTAATTVKVSLDAINFDTHSGADTGNGRWVCPVAGYYELEGTVRYNNNTSTAGQISVAIMYVNGVSVAEGASSSLGSGGSSVSTIAKLVPGDYVELYTYNTAGTSMQVGSAFTFVNIKRLSGPATIAASEKVCVVAHSTTGMSVPAGSVWTKKTFDTTNKNSHGTWSSNTFTAPRSDTYIVSYQDGFTSPGTNYFGLAIYKNGSLYARVNTFLPANTYDIIDTITRAIPLNAGDTLEFYIKQSDVSARTTLGTDAGFISIISQG